MAFGQLKPSFSWVSSTAFATHLSVMGVGAGDTAVVPLTCAQTRLPVVALGSVVGGSLISKAHASSPVRSRTAVSEVNSTSKIPDPEFEANCRSGVRGEGGGVRMARVHVSGVVCLGGGGSGVWGCVGGGGAHVNPVVITKPSTESIHVAFAACGPGVVDYDAAV